MNKDVWLTTIDNPYDYFTQFDKWYSYDMAKGYDTCGRIARIAFLPEGISDYWSDRILEDAIDEVIELEPKLYKKIYNTKEGGV